MSDPPYQDLPAVIFGDVRQLAGRPYRDRLITGPFDGVHFYGDGGGNHPDPGLLQEFVSAGRLVIPTLTPDTMTEANLARIGEVRARMIELGHNPIVHVEGFRPGEHGLPGDDTAYERARQALGLLGQEFAEYHSNTLSSYPSVEPEMWSAQFYTTRIDPISSWVAEVLGKWHREQRVRVSVWLYIHPPGTNYTDTWQNRLFADLCTAWAIGCERAYLYTYQAGLEEDPDLWPMLTDTVAAFKALGGG